MRPSSPLRFHDIHSGRFVKRLLHHRRKELDSVYDPTVSLNSVFHTAIMRVSVIALNCTLALTASAHVDRRQGETPWHFARSALMADVESFISSVVGDATSLYESVTDDAASGLGVATSFAASVTGGAGSALSSVASVFESATGDAASALTSIANDASSAIGELVRLCRLS